MIRVKFIDDVESTWHYRDFESDVEAEVALVAWEGRNHPEVAYQYYRASNVGEV